MNSQSINHDVNDILNELKDQDNRRCNVVITGLNPSRSSDDALVETILNELHATTTISSLRRLKSRQSTQPAPLLVTFASTSGCSNVIKSAKNLRTTSTPEFKNVYINPDLTHTRRLK